MLKSVSKILLIAYCLLSIAYSQTGKATFIEPIKVDQSRYMIWSGYVIDSAYLNVHLPNGDLPRRENGTFKYWLEDANGNLIPRRKIDYRLPIFKEQSVVMKREDENFFK